MPRLRTSFEQNCVMMCLYPGQQLHAHIWEWLQDWNCSTCMTVHAAISEHSFTAIAAMRYVLCFIPFLPVTLQNTELLKWSQHPVSMQTFPCFWLMIWFSFFFFVNSYIWRIADILYMSFMDVLWVSVQFSLGFTLLGIMQSVYLWRNTKQNGCLHIGGTWRGESGQAPENGWTGNGRTVEQCWRTCQSAQRRT